MDEIVRISIADTSEIDTEEIAEILNSLSLPGRIAVHNMPRTPIASGEWWLPPAVALLVFSGFFTKIGELGAETFIDFMQKLWRSAKFSKPYYFFGPKDVSDTGELNISNTRKPPGLTTTFLEEIDGEAARFIFVMPIGLNDEQANVAFHLMIESLDMIIANWSIHKINSSGVRRGQLLIFDQTSMEWVESLALIKRRSGRI